APGGRAPPRHTPCRRGLGGAVRAQSFGIHTATARTAFGKPIGQHQGVGFMLADNQIAIQKCWLMIWWACWVLDQGEQGRHESSMTKAMVSEELFKVADRCVQVLGGIGISDETPVAGFFRDVRAFRLYDGTTEVHQHAIAGRLLRD
ncbi:MAG: acyl-CoA dehydrogenase family protein, partial [Acidimicrobiales bacterium]